ncbi:MULTISPECIES: hypothetical protein [Clostridium]|uniref:Lipoprotein n=3 Tax=Clostridium TaxID=1485 RepID=D8GQM2_CLOLD|nr:MULTISPECIES: hypothetical protein [Clostridium]ADK14145.1 conserved hypothetical protein [Clostridium ljungdahlii DSM 13528]OAA86178.1 hypothetical protein WX45_04201 [Clostridium ljungdahlii DSM 13528]OAA89241.1 hypothetical protein WX73_02495 [Clostridium coskatii]OBR97349.1 hypothetical protein CLCOS_04070 [Clostridium coskatii]RMC94869.1 hypothetical protein D9O40_16990 [Clostridium autoethanogenum]
MKNFRMIIFFVFMSFTFLILSSCTPRDVNKGKSGANIHYSNVIAVEAKETDTKIFNVDNYKLSQNLTNNNINNIEEMLYDTKKTTFIYLNKEKDSNKNKIDIITKDSVDEVKDFYNARDIKMDSTGDKIAFRTFKNSSVYSAEGMKVYDIKNKKYLDIKSKVLVSGDLYEWLDDHRIIYYGSIEGKANSNRVYIYDFNTDREQIYLNDIKGYCIYFIPLGNDILFLSRSYNELYLYFYNNESKQFTLLSDGFTEIYSSVSDKNRKSVFFIGNQKDNNTALYEFKEESGTVNRITYDFPQTLGISSGIAEDESGNVYFTGIGNSGQQDNLDVFMYNADEKSINVISEHAGKYKIYKNNEM